MLFKIATFLMNVYYFLLSQVSFILIPITKICVKRFLNNCGVIVNGNQDCDPQVKDDKFYAQILTRGFSGIGFAFDQNYFECNDLISLCEKIYTIDNYEKYRYYPSIYLPSFVAKYLFAQTNAMAESEVYAIDKSKDNNDEYNNYVTLSSGYWRDATNLEESFMHKFELIAKKLELSEGMRVLDVGCGEGTLCKHLAENYGVSVLGINVSQYQIDKAKKLCAGLDVRLERMNAMNVKGVFDRIVCVQVIEHFGSPLLRPFFERMHRCLTDDGILHIEISLIFNSAVPSTEAYINSTRETFYFPSLEHLAQSIDGLFVMEHIENIANDKFLTCKALFESIKGENFEKQRENEAALIATFSALQSNRCFNLCHVVLTKCGNKV